MKIIDRSYFGSEIFGKGDEEDKFTLYKISRTES